MRLRYLTAVVAMAPSLAFAQTVPGPVVRTTTTTITTGAAADFSGASYVYQNEFAFNDGVGAYAFTFNFQPGATGIYLNGTNGATVAPPTVPDGAPLINAVASLIGSAGQGMSIGYNGGALGFLTPGIVGGRYALTFNGGGTNILNTGGTFSSTVSILGDWTDAASHTIATFDPDYSILDNFVFAGGYTTFSVVNRNYQGPNPTISFSLLGGTAPVPEPATWAMMILGFGIVGFALRRARRDAVGTQALA